MATPELPPLHWVGAMQIDNASFQSLATEASVYARERILLARIAELEAEVADLSRRLTTESRRVLIQQREDARAEVERLRADAERYRWLREYNTVRHPEVTEAFFLGDANLDAALDAARGEAVAFQKAAGLENTPTEFTLPFRQAVEGTGYLAHEWKDKPHRLIFDLCRYIERNDAAPPAALPEPLFLLHTGAVYGNERGDWEIEANSGKAVDAYCDANPGKTVGLYLATQAPPAPAVPEDARDAARYRWLVDSGTDTYSMFVEAESKAKLDAAIDAAIAAARSAP